MAQRQRVVVADDSRLMRRMLADALGRQGFDGELGRKVRAAADAHAGHLRRPMRTGPHTPSAAYSHSRARASDLITVIACSTGGPRALGDLVPRLPSPLGAGTLLVQHMPPGFTASLAARLDAAGPLTVREAAGGERLSPGTVLLAPGGAHLRLADDGRVRLSDEAPIGGLRPRADLTIEDVARAGFFSAEDARTAPRAALRRWFEPTEDGGWRAGAELRRMVRFETGDLLRMPMAERSHDLILCRNTVIYFTEEGRDALHGRLAAALAPGGHLIVGTSERVADPRGLGLSPVVPFVYRRD